MSLRCLNLVCAPVSETSDDPPRTYITVHGRVGACQGGRAEAGIHGQHGHHGPGDNDPGSRH